MQITVNPVVCRGRVQAPPSKSVAHRYLIGAALAGAETITANIGRAEDVLATRDCLARLGTEAPFCCGASGSTLRFLIPVVLACRNKGTFIVTERLFQRGIGVYERVLPEHGIEITPLTSPEGDLGREFGWHLKGGLQPGKYVVPGNQSSQYISGLLFALPLLAGDSELQVTGPVASRFYIDLTLAVLRQFGINIRTADSVGASGTETMQGDLLFQIPGGQKYSHCDFKIEGDWSNGAVLLALNLLGGQVEVENLASDSCQGDKICLKFFRQLQQQQGLLAFDLRDCPDLGPLLFSLAAYAMQNRQSGEEISFKAIQRLRFKESDRVAVMLQELAKFGAKYQVSEDFLKFLPARLHKPEAILRGHNDHRVVMALAVLATAFGGTIEGAEAVEKSWPEFWQVMAEVASLQGSGIKAEGGAWRRRIEGSGVRGKAPSDEGADSEAD